MTTQNHHQLVFPDDSRYDDARRAWKPYLNFAEKRVAIGDAVGAEAFARLETIKAAIDPEGRFRSGHALAATPPLEVARAA